MDDQAIENYYKHVLVHLNNSHCHTSKGKKRISLSRSVELELEAEARGVVRGFALERVPQRVVGVPDIYICDRSE